MFTVGVGLILNKREKYAYLILDYVSGETISEKVNRESMINPYEAKDIIIGVLKGLEYLHNLSSPIIHNALHVTATLNCSQYIVETATPPIAFYRKSRRCIPSLPRF